jgi:preprotein translocase subunit Sss1
MGLSEILPAAAVGLVILGVIAFLIYGEMLDGAEC